MKKLTYYRYFMDFNKAIKKFEGDQLTEELEIELFRKIIDEYKGGGSENRYHIPQNDKDRKIQAIMREQLGEPRNKEILLKAMDLLYFLEINESKLLEEIIKKHSGFLNEKERLHYRLHYASNKIDKFTEIIENINNVKKTYPKNYFDVEFYEGLSNFVGNDYNELNTKSAQKAVKKYLENNAILIDDNEDDDKHDFFNLYGNWLRAYAAATGNTGLEKSLFEMAKISNDPKIILAVLSILVDSYDPEYYTSKYYEKLIDNKETLQFLEQTFFDQASSDEIKGEIRFRLRGVSEKFPIEEESEPRDFKDVYPNMSDEEKAELKIAIKEAIKHERFFRKPLLWWLLIRYF